MQDPLNTILFYDDLSPAQQEAFRAACAADPALAETAAHWEHVRGALRHSLNAKLPDRRLFVLYALQASGHADVLSEEERRELLVARPLLISALEAHPGLNEVATDIDAAYDDFEACWDSHFSKASQPTQEAAHDQKVRRSATIHPMVRWGWRVAAAVAVVAFVTIMTLILQRDRSLTTITVAEGETQLIELADGSTVRLLGGSTLVYADPEEATAFNRHVSLNGQAFFDITADQQGFTVETPTALTTVLGTSFGIQADEAEMLVVLATGSIAVASKAVQEGLVVLEPGQMSRVARNALPSSPAPVDLTEALDWTGLFLFQATPLSEAATMLSDRYGIAIRVSPDLGVEAVSGTFAREQSLQQILNTLAITVNASVQGSDAAGYTVRPQGP